MIAELYSTAAEVSSKVSFTCTAWFNNLAVHKHVQNDDIALQIGIVNHTLFLCEEKTFV